MSILKPKKDTTITVQPIPVEEPAQAEEMAVAPEVTKDIGVAQEVLDASKKWIAEVNAIKDSLSLEELIFRNELQREFTILKGKFRFILKTVSFGALMDIADECYKRASDTSELRIGQEHNLLLLCESVVAMGAGALMDLPETRAEKYDVLKRMNATLLNKVLEKYNQFESAVRLLVSDEDGAPLEEKLKK